MTELGAVFLLALATQGYTWTVQDGDLVIPRREGGQYRLSMEVLNDPINVLLLMDAIEALTIEEAGFHWPPPGGAGRN